MGQDRKADGFSLRRWSQRKLAAKRDERAVESAHESDGPPAPSAVASRDAAPLASVDPVSPVASPPVAASGTATSPPEAGAGPVLPPVESLTFDSDFTAFMKPGVDENVRRGALRKLLRDPRFNVMDGLDVYIDDYSKPSPIEPEVVRTLWQARYLFDPPKTRLNADGVVEDVPEHEAAVDDDAAENAEALQVAHTPADVSMDLPTEVDASGSPPAAARDDDASGGQRRDTGS